MRPPSIEWPTLAVAAAIAAGFTILLTRHDSLPTAGVVIALAVLGAWYNSLQHEVVHGHPTPWRVVNLLVAITPLGLVDSFPSYRRTHVAHHANPDLTDPATDPESFYVSEATWARCGPVRRAVLHALRTLLGRLVLGPILRALRTMLDAVVRIRTTADVARLVAHLAGVSAVLAVVVRSGMPVWVYVVGVAWGGGALTLLRSFAEHREEIFGTRSAVVRTGWSWSLLFLNNNLHHTHHARPGLAWYAIPAAHRRLDSDAIAAGGAGLYHGYRDVVRRYLVRPIDHPVFGADRQRDAVISYSTSPSSEPLIVSPQS